MPRGDGTGPEGKGPRTGRSLGKASGNNMGSGIGKPRRTSGGRNSRRKNSGQGLGRDRNRS
ncbi:MAG: DUF5320 domain-containing protein [Candidatus Cloacimonetes bacterium]|nr:DUF5320 domain-containing protein [Candidatus Cloacimonadota bacterium]